MPPVNFEVGNAQASSDIAAGNAGSGTIDVVADQTKFYDSDKGRPRIGVKGAVCGWSSSRSSMRRRRPRMGSTLRHVSRVSVSWHSRCPLFGVINVDVRIDVEPAVASGAANVVF